MKCVYGRIFWNRISAVWNYSHDPVHVCHDGHVFSHDEDVQAENGWHEWMLWMYGDGL